MLILIQNILYILNYNIKTFVIFIANNSFAALTFANVYGR